MAASASSTTAAAGALSAFLKGVERRALVVAGLQGGDGDAAGHAVAAAMRAFAGPAAGMPLADWPVRFWSLLCGSPQLRAPSTGGSWPPPLAHLRGLAPAERLALLLRIGAGLDEDAAATVLGMAPEDYRRALSAACPLDVQGYPDAAAWRGLAEQVQAQVRDLPPDRLQQLDHLRGSMAAAAAHARTPAPAPDSAPARRADAGDRAARPPRRAGSRWTWRTWLLLCLPLLLLAAVAAWWWREHGLALPGTAAPAAEGAVSDNGPVQVEALPAEDVPAAPPADGSRAAADAAMLADPELALAQDADFYAWHAAGGPVPVDESQAQPGRTEPPGSALETVDAED
ncbi:hypothetical protein CQ393_05680 [Stenotrophomonas sp. MYb238]|uniref:hypothetical protein n=1 Tax=Stenotrophomonas sp. MYb238 TaxID=2040281 RepID=UPI00129260BA|nr:hypothetical protein [Stenotrophomonas sp. MYb238]MQP75379.1 hypothetical protein [Stenotrophomonas sp. MYb238]